MRTESLNIDLNLPVKGIALLDADYKQKARSRIQRWQDKYDPEGKMKFKAFRVIQGYAVLRVA